MVATSSYSSPCADSDPRKSRSSRSTRRWNDVCVRRREPHALLRLLVGALDHVEPRDAAVEALGQGADAARADDLHEPGALEHLQVVRDRALREPDALGELGRRRRPLTQDGDDPEPDVVGERAQLLGLGDDEDVVRLVVRLGKIETVDGCRNIRQPSTVRKCYGMNVPSGPAGVISGEPAESGSLPARRSPTASSTRTSAGVRDQRRC